MLRITGADVAVDLHGAGKDGFADPDPGVTAATTVGADWLNAIQEEILTVIESAGLTPGSANTQLNEAIGQSVVTIAQDESGVRAIAIAIANHVARTVPTAASYKRVAYGASDAIFVATNDDASGPHTSVDGVTWANESVTALNDVCHGLGRFLCVGPSAAIVTSETGASAFIARTPAGAFAGTFRCCTFGTLFVIGGDSAEIQSSADGLTWNARTAAGGFAGAFLGACYGGGLYVLVGEDTSVPEIQTSPDGTNYTARAPSEPSGSLYGVAYGGGVYVAVGIDGGGDNLIMRSDDAITWETIAAPNGMTGGFFSVSHDDDHGVFVAVGATGAIAISADGATWRDISRPSFTGSIRGVAFGDGTCVLAGSSSVLRQSLAYPFLP